MIPRPFLLSVGVTALILAGCATPPRAVSLAEAESHTVTAGTNKIHYVTAGKGDHTLVLVHCWAGNLTFWREQVPALSDKARLVLLDLPGHGKSDKPDTAYTMDFFADAVLAVMRDANVRKATLVGHSMGVPVVCTVYRKAPEKVSALVFVDGTPRRPPSERGGDDRFERFIAGFRGPDYQVKTREFIGRLFVPGTEALREQVLAELLATPQRVMVGSMNGMFGPGQPDWDPKQVKAPVLALNAPSPLWNAEYERHLRSLSTRHDYRVIPNTGHWLMLEKPAEFNAALLEMLRKFELVAK